MQFKLDKVSMLNFVKFEFLSMTLKIERVFEEKKLNFESKTGQTSPEFNNKKHMVSTKVYKNCKILK